MEVLAICLGCILSSEALAVRAECLRITRDEALVHALSKHVVE